MNMRKILGVLVAVLMLCTVIPMGAMSVSAAPGDVLVDWNFDDGVAHLERGTVEDGYLVFDSSTGDWQNCYAYGNGFQTGVDYVVTFKAKADRATTLNFKINDNWGADAAAFTVDVTTEWQEFEGTINMASLTSAIVMFSSNAYAANGATYYIDDVKIVEYKEPLESGVIANGDFENGSEGWTLNASASVVDGALQLDNPSAWAEAAMAEFAVEVGTEYTLSWKSQRVSGTGAFLMFVLKGDSTNHTINGTNWMNSTSTEWVESSITFVAEEANLKLKISPEVADAGIILIDDIVLAPVEYGQVENGDFETGDLSGWTYHQSTAISTDAHSGSYAANIKGDGGWGGMLNQDVTVEAGKTYHISIWVKANANGANIQIKDGGTSGANLASTWFTKTEWTEVTWDVVPTTDVICFNFCGGGNGIAEDVLVDDITVTELKDPSNDGFVVNGDFEIGEAAPWTLYSGSNVSADAAYNGDYGLICTNPTGGWGGTAYQDFTVTVGKTYEVTMWAKAISQGQNIQVQNPIGNNVAGAWFNKTAWTQLTFQFTATDPSVRINICGGGTNASEEVYFDDIKVVELIDPSFDGYIYNGDFETGELHPWDNLYGNNTVEIVEGMDGGYGLNVIAKKWNHVRQTGIAVEANTWYKVTVWAKNTNNMCVLVKDGADTTDIINNNFSAGEEWTEIVYYFNSGEYTTIILSLMGGDHDEDGDRIGTFDNISIVAEEPGCEEGYHKYFYACDKYCMECGEETNPDADHTIEHVEAKAAVSCVEYGNKEYWYCTACGTAWLDANLIRQTNMMSVRIAGECISDAEFPCQDGECVNCGLPCYADAEHEYDNDYDADCNVCGEVREVELPDVVYGDANGDGLVDIVDEALLAQYNAGWDVELNEAAADANGDGVVDIVDEALLAQYNAGWDVVLGG